MCMYKCIYIDIYIYIYNHVYIYKTHNHTLYMIHIYITHRQGRSLALGLVSERVLLELGSLGVGFAHSPARRLDK